MLLGVPRRVKPSAITSVVQPETKCMKNASSYTSGNSTTKMSEPPKYNIGQGIMTMNRVLDSSYLQFLLLKQIEAIK